MKHEVTEIKLLHLICTDKLLSAVLLSPSVGSSFSFVSEGFSSANNESSP